MPDTPPSNASGGGDPFRSLLSAAMRGLRGISAWADANREPIGRALNAVMTYAVVNPELERLRAKYEGTEWEHVLNQLDLVAGIVLLVELDEGEDAADDLVEDVVTAPEFIDQVRTRVRASRWPAPHRDQLDAGLAYLRARKYELAVPLLINPLEGLFYLEAEERALVRRDKEKMRFISEARAGKSAGSVESLFEPLGLDEDYVSFLRRQVYGGSGNPYRHGTAVEGFKHKALVLSLALISLLELIGEESQPSLLAAGFAGREHNLDQLFARLRARSQIAS